MVPIEGLVGGDSLNLGAKEEMIDFGICKICGTKFRRRETMRKHVLDYEVWHYLVPEMQFAGVKFGPAWGRWIRKKRTRILADNLSSKGSK